LLRLEDRTIGQSSIPHCGELCMGDLQIACMQASSAFALEMVVKTCCQLDPSGQALESWKAGKLESDEVKVA
jgi:hypothetical protein